MTDPVIAPSFHEQVERFDFVPHGYYQHLSAERADEGEWMRAEDVLPLLTRAAALARAAEKVIEAQSGICIEGVCEVCEADLISNTKRHKADCAWLQLRALVLSEGSGK